MLRNKSYYNKLHNSLIRGKCYRNFDLSKLSFFKVGGPCDLFFVPEDIEDLQNFIAHNSLPITVLGNMSNVLILDGGIRGCVISLSKLNRIKKYYSDTVEVECGVNLSKFIKEAATQGISCCERLYTIPGTVGGALAMNAGVPEFEISDALKSFTYINDFEELIVVDDINMSYRNGNLPGIAVSCILECHKDNSQEILQRLKHIFVDRLKKQPITVATCGSTFKNPDGYKAWQLIKDSGCSELKIGGAGVSPLHCNFIVNNGNATASDILELINLIKDRVLQYSGILLKEEIKIIGEM